MSDCDKPTPLVDEKAPDVAQASSLCTQCGLCCMGAIHVRAVLDEDEVQAASAIGLPTYRHGDRAVFALPCPKLVGTACSIFGQRPRVCSRYQCQLLQDFRAGEVPFEAATKKVTIASDLLRSVRNFMPRGMSLHDACALMDAKVKPSTAMSEGALAQLRLRVIALEVYLDRNFRASRDGQMLGEKPVEHG